MIFPLFRRAARRDTISALYGTIVAKARFWGFYRDYAVPDTVSGRFDRPARRGVGAAYTGTGLFDRFWRDMDHNLREMGVDDRAVPRQMHGMGDAFYGRAQAIGPRWPQATTKPWPRRSNRISMAERRMCPVTALRPICGGRYVS
jgi:cytochrome b pre-mRNA-processing protein 3